MTPDAASLWRRASRAWMFARHIPARQLTRRAHLGLRRRLRDRLPLWHVQRKPPALSQIPPRSAFAPRAHLAPDFDAEWTFRFLNRSVAMRGTSIDWMAPGPGPADQLWRMNLHYMEWLEGVDDDTFCAAVLDWIAVNPAKRRAAWRDSWNAYALSLRIVVWMAETTRRGSASFGDAHGMFVESLAEQVRFLVRNLETDIGGNHLIKNITALLWASAFFEGAEARRWRHTAIALLGGEVDRQVLPDGVHYERSPSYHCQVFADLLDCRHVLGCDPLRGRLDAALHRMAQACADLAHPDGHVALFNDAGLSMARVPAECLAIYDTIFAVQRPTARHTFAFPDVGYFGVRSAGALCIVDCGRIAPDELPAHGHGDVLSFEWSVGGRRIVVDPGVFEYLAGERRAASRTAARHNTLCFEGADQADFFGAFRCGRRPNVTVHRWQPNANGFVLEGSHDGFAYLAGRPRHIRQFNACADAITIEDRIDGAPDKIARVGLLLHPDVIVTRTGLDLILQQANVAIRVTCSALLEVEPAIWWPDMGVERATSRLVATLARGTRTLQTILSVVPSGDGQRISV